MSAAAAAWIIVVRSVVQPKLHEIDIFFVRMQPADAISVDYHPGAGPW